MRITWGIWLLVAGVPGIARAQSGAGLPDRSEARAAAEHVYAPVRHTDAVANTRSVDLVVRGYDSRGRATPCTIGDSADVRVALRWATTRTKQDLLIYAISVGRTWRYVDAIRLLIDDWLLTPRQAASPNSELARYEQGVVETSAYEITRPQLVFMARAKSVQIRLVGGGGLCDFTLDPVSRELIGLFVERELGSPPAIGWSDSPTHGQAR